MVESVVAEGEEDDEVGCASESVVWGRMFLKMLMACVTMDATSPVAAGSRIVLFVLANFPNACTYCSATFIDTKRRKKQESRDSDC